MRLGGRRLRVLTYHRVAEAGASDDLNPRLVSATPGAFERQMRMLSRRHAVVSMAEARRTTGMIFRARLSAWGARLDARRHRNLA